MNDAVKGGGAALVAVLVVPLAIIAAVLGVLSTEEDCSDLPINSGGATGTPGQKVWPMKKGTYQLTSGFGPRWGSMHQGIDLGAAPGAPIYAAYDGVVTKSGPASGFGEWIVLSHNLNGTAVDTVYGHMFPQDLLVKEGQKVTAGQEIAKVGYNGQVSPPGPGGAHLHFEVWEGGWGSTAIDPAPWLTDAAEPGAAPAPAADGVVAVAQVNEVTVADWNKVAEHESGGDWKINTGNGFYGGLQFLTSTWKAFGGEEYAPRADLASPAEQMEVANTTLKAQGWDAWPATSHKAGVRGKKPAPAGAFVSGAGRTTRSTAPDQKPAAAAQRDTRGSLNLATPISAQVGSEQNLQVNAVRLARAVHQRFPEITVIGGWRADGGYATDHPEGRAIDFMIPGDGRTPEGVELGNRIQRYVMDNKDLFKVDYTIWRQYYQPSQGAGNVMEDRQSWTQNHMDHVHVTLFTSERFSGGDLGSAQDRTDGQTGSAQCSPQGSGNQSAVDVAAGTVPAEWARWYNKAGRVCPQITPSLLAAQGHAETGFRPNLTSPDAAMGPGQFIPSTWAAYGKDYDGDGRVDVFSLGDALMAQGHYMCAIAAKVDGWISAGKVDASTHPGGRPALYVAGYNAGEYAVLQSGGFPNQVPRHFSETLPYADKILANEPIYRGQLPGGADE